MPSLRGRVFVEALRETFAAACQRDGFALIHYSVQRDHVHMIVESDDQEALGRGMKAVASRIAFAANRVFQRSGPVMAGRYHARHLTSPRQVRNGLRYVLLNVRKHRFSSNRNPGPATIDDASSGRWFDGWRSTSAPTTRSPREVATPTTWLLRKGWRRHGRIGLDELPGDPATSTPPS